MTNKPNNVFVRIAALLAIALPAANADAAWHIFINPDIFAGSTDRAFVDVSGEPLNADVQITVLSPAGGNQVTVPMNQNNFATSPDLFPLSSGRSSLVFARTTDATTPSVAVLRQQQGTTKIAVTIPSSNRMLGRAFNLPLGDLSSGPNNLYIANPNGADTQAIIQFGASTSPVDSIVTIPANGIVKVPISATHAQTNMLITARDVFPLVAEAVFGTRLEVVLPIWNAIDP
jgi:hypothetical protein